MALHGRAQKADLGLKPSAPTRAFAPVARGHITVLLEALVKAREGGEPGGVGNLGDGAVAVFQCPAGGFHPRFREVLPEAQSGAPVKQPAQVFGTDVETAGDRLQLQSFGVVLLYI